MKTRPKNMPNKHTNNQAHPTGFTLIELALATAIFVFLIVFVLAGLVNVMTLFQKSNTVRANQQAARIVVDDIKRETSFASNVYVDPMTIPPTTHSTISQGAAPGLCIDRAYSGEVFYFVNEEHDYETEVYPGQVASAQKLIGAVGQVGSVKDIIFQSGGNEANITGSVNVAGFYNTKRVYKTDSCTAADRYDISRSSTVAVGGNDLIFDDVSAAFFVITPITTNNDFISRSLHVSLTMTQKGPPGSAISSNNPKKQFDDSVTLTIVATPALLQQ